ncbi:hypothetical protein [Achromobacter sp. Bel]|uniref:hypothetical protein n=1 Tax=Achromobacter sp. Bel TaxID=2727415 RepID=UPI00145FC635|nr:hypothetical protein [Achromobacter sp. Bel]NMK49606.1 hypothetical protein [Achromobacter sp. Bel]
MAEDEKRSSTPTSIPSLLAGRASSAEARESSRILAALEGRVPEAEVKHLAPKRRSKAPMLVLLLLLLSVVGAGMWAVFDTPALPDVVVTAETPASASNNSERSQTALPAAAMAQAPAPSEPEPPASTAATIVEDHPLAQLTRERDREAGEPSNPLSALAVTAAAPKPAAVPAAPHPASAKAPGPTVQRAEHGRDPAATAKASAPRGKAAPRSDSDAALLATLMSYGLPPASPPGTKVYKSDGIFIRELPGSPLSARLAECRKLGFLESEQCRLRVCAGHWGTAAECPNAQAHTEP